MNNINLTGRLTRDAEIKTVGDSNVISLSICNDDESKKDQAGNYERIPSFFDCSIWSKTGKIANHLLKGKVVTVSGRLKQETWTTAEGANRSRVVIKAFEVVPHKFEEAGTMPEQTGQEASDPFDNNPSDPF